MQSTKGELGTGLELVLVLLLGLELGLGLLLIAGVGFSSCFLVVLQSHSSFLWFLEALVTLLYAKPTFPEFMQRFNYSLHVFFLESMHTFDPILVSNF